MTLTQTAKDAATAQVAASKAVSDAEAELQRLEDLGTAAQNELDAQKVKVTAAKATLTTMPGRRHHGRRRGHRQAGRDTEAQGELTTLQAAAVTAKNAEITKAQGELTLLQADASKAAAAVTANTAGRPARTRCASETWVFRVVSWPCSVLRAASAALMSPLSLSRAATGHGEEVLSGRVDRTPKSVWLYSG